MAPLLRRTFDPTRLLAEHPPVLRHPHKRLVFELACPPAAVHRGPIELSRWPAAPLPAVLALGDPEVTAVAGPYDYAGDPAGVWHVNFADPELFFAYGSPLLAQDELQAAEHPALGAIREALVAEGEPARTEDDGAPTPVLVAGVERRCALATGPDAASGRPHGLYGNRFAAAPAAAVRAAVHVLDPPGRTNLIAIAAPVGSGRYRARELAAILTCAATGFAAAATESARLWPGAAVEVRTGFWGCGAFGGNRRVMALLQVLAARIARLDRLRFHAFDDAGRADFEAATAELAELLTAQAPGEGTWALIERLEARGHAWGVGDGT